MRKRMFSGKAELMRDGLGEYVLHHMVRTPELRMSETRSEHS